jgi:hypothetical protein
MPDIQKVSFTGTLMAGLPVDDSTGLSLIGDQQFVINGKTVNSVGIGLAGRKAPEYVDRHLSISGVMQNRGSHDTNYFWPVVVAEEISEVPYSGVATKSFDAEGLSVSLSIQPALFPLRASPGPTMKLSLSNHCSNPKTLDFKNRAQVCFRVTEIAGPFGTFKQVWSSNVAAPSPGTRITINPNMPFEVATALPSQAAKKDAAYLLNASVSEYDNYSLQTQFRVRG